MCHERRAHEMLISGIQKGKYEYVQGAGGCVEM
jgi:hypothetical protein